MPSPFLISPPVTQASQITFFLKVLSTSSGKLPPGDWCCLSVWVGKFLWGDMEASDNSAKSLQSCPTPSDPMDCSPPGSSIHGIFQARVLEFGALAFSDNSSSIHYSSTCLSPVVGTPYSPRNFQAEIWLRAEMSKQSKCAHWSGGHK